MGSPALHAALQLLRFLDHGNDLVVSSAAGGFIHYDAALALFNDGAGVHVAADGLPYRDGLSGHGGLVDRGLALTYLAVQRDDIARMDDDGVAYLYIGDID